MEIWFGKLHLLLDGDLRKTGDDSNAREMNVPGVTMSASPSTV